MENNKLKQNLKQIEILPCVKWQKKVASMLSEKPESHNNSLFYFLHNLHMNVKSKTFAAISAVVVVALGGTVAYASNNAIPGDFLYPVDKVVENISRVFTSSPIDEAELEIELMEERLEELDELNETDEDDDKIESSLNEILSQIEELDEARETLTQALVDGDITEAEYNELMNSIDQIESQLDTYLNDPTSFDDDALEDMIEDILNEVEEEDEEESEVEEKDEYESEPETEDGEDDEDDEYQKPEDQEDDEDDEEDEYEEPESPEDSEDEEDDN